MQVTVVDEPQIEIKKSCLTCDHLKVCAVYRAIKEMIDKNWKETDEPFEPEKLAEICNYYTIKV